MFQVTVDLGYNKHENLDKFEKYLHSFDTTNPNAMRLPHVEAKGDYSNENHEFYLIRFEEDAETFEQKIRDTGLVKEVGTQKY